MDDSFFPTIFNQFSRRVFSHFTFPAELEYLWRGVMNFLPCTYPLVVPLFQFLFTRSSSTASIWLPSYFCRSGGSHVTETCNQPGGRKLGHTYLRGALRMRVMTSAQPSAPLPPRGGRHVLLFTARAAFCACAVGQHAAQFSVFSRRSMAGNSCAKANSPVTIQPDPWEPGEVSDFSSNKAWASLYAKFWSCHPVWKG